MNVMRHRKDIKNKGPQGDVSFLFIIVFLAL